jgi:hypothetical protein
MLPSSAIFRREVLTIPQPLSTPAGLRQRPQTPGDALMEVVDIASSHQGLIKLPCGLVLLLALIVTSHLKFCP